ncbi:uncharacterized protein LOC141655208 [Silene latifolia]|uniref:uncharacterized protein LOC141655208 n=1 Tax=Silene latifolia TaxID=37657 RepID=UPI003D77781D
MRSQTLPFESWRSILHTRDLLLTLYGTADSAEKALQTCVSSQGHFMVSKAYELLRPHYPKVRWAKTIWSPNVIPKHSFITALAAQGKLPTVDNLCRRGLYLVNWCVLCKGATENHAHLFFACPFAGDLWRQVLGWMRVYGRTANLRQELLWCRHRNSRKHWKAGWYCCWLAACVYTIWQERNTRIFTGKESGVHGLLRQVQFHVSVKMLARNVKHSNMVIDHLSSIYA